MTRHLFCITVVIGLFLLIGSSAVILAQGDVTADEESTEVIESNDSNGINLGEGGIIALILFIISWAAKKWMIPFLNTGLKKKMAEYILLMADEITDELVAKYPDKQVWLYVDQAVDKLMNIVGLKKKQKEAAKRAIEASLARKGVKRNQ